MSPSITIPVPSILFAKEKLETKNEFKQSLRKTLSNEFMLNTSKSKFSFKFSWGLQKTTAVIAIAFISIISSGLLVTSASASSLPGETLYPAKKLKEGIMLRIIPSDAQKVKFHTNLIQQRTQEMELIISKKKSASDLNSATQNINSHIEKTFTIILANKVLNGLTISGQALQPKTGMLCMFPAWLDHCVEANRTDKRRISFAFNFIKDDIYGY